MQFEEWSPAGAAAPGGAGGKPQGSQTKLDGESGGASASTSTSAWPGSDPSSTPRPRGAPLREVVADGVERWFQETLREAQRGDIKQQALLGEMLTEGYGCDPDPKAGREWAEKARKRGYRMRRVYCEL